MEKLINANDKLVFNPESDEIFLVAPASCADRSEFAKVIDLLKANRLKIRYSEKFLDGDKKWPFFAATKNIRFSSLKSALLDPKVKIIWGIKGGYGSIELISDLLKIPISYVKPKIFIGFSDLTIMHVLFNQYFRMPSIHAPVLIQAANNQKKLFDTLNIFTKNKLIYPLIRLDKNKQEIEEPSIKGEIIGGNIITLCSLLGNRYLQVDMKDKIILLEECDEKLYALHRALMQLLNAGLFDKCKAILFGDFVNIKHNNQSADIYNFMKNFIRSYISVPSYIIKNVGHGEINNPIIFGSVANINYVQKRNYELSMKVPFEITR